MQQMVLPVALIPDLGATTRGIELPVRLEAFSMQELEHAATRRAPSKATRQGDIPSEVFKGWVSGSQKMI